MPSNNIIQRKPIILIVDDDATIRLLMSDALRDHNYTIDEAENGTHALERIKQHKPDLVLLDVNMPGLNGFDVCEEIREKYGDTDISVVMVTGLDDSASIERAYAQGATDFISKPINWDTFPYRIQYLIKARDAIIETKHKEKHLQHIEDVSRILTQNKKHSEIMQETMQVVLEIFDADRAFIIKPAKAADDTLTIDTEATSANTDSITSSASSLFDILGSFSFHRAVHSEYPIISHFGLSDPSPSYDDSLKQQMMKSMSLQGDQTWYLVIQQCDVTTNWSSLDEETFYKICLRLTGILSRHLLTDELHRSEQLLKQAQRIGHLGNWNWNVETNLLTWSDEIYRIYGHERERWSPNCEDFFEVKFEEDVQRYNLFNNILSNTVRSYQIDHRINTSSHNVRWVREQCVGTFDKQGVLVEVNGIVQDITDAHIKKEQEVHNHKMDAIGQLTSGVAHDFGNLMTVAKGNLDLLKDTLSSDNSLDNNTLELIDDAYSAVQDSVELTKQLLTFSRKKSIAPVAVDIQDTINKFEKLLKNTVGNSIELSIDIQQALPEILVDLAQFESTILNLVINARNAMPDGGHVTIGAEIMATQRSQELIRNADNDLGETCICIFVKDDGIGMTSDVLERAIEPFYTTSKTTGTGLGLSMVYGFIKQSAGELLIHSRPRKGTTIYMQFPIYEGLVAQPTRSDVAKELPDSLSTILIVEDQATVRQFAVRCLEQPGIDIIEARDAMEARKHLENNDVDLLFTDVLMPGDMNGHELAGWASEKYPDLKILLTTAMENKANSQQPERNHNFHMLPKPYNKFELTESICKSLG